MYENCHVWARNMQLNAYTSPQVQKRSIIIRCNKTLLYTNRLPMCNHKVCVSAYHFLCVTKWPFFVETSGPLFFKQINKKSKNFLLFSSCIWFYLGMFTICLKVVYTCLLSLDYGAMEKSSLAHVICVSTVHR